MSDPTNYYIYGVDIASGHGYRNAQVYWENLSRAFSGEPPLPRPHTAFYPPGYPFALGGVFWLALNTPIPDHDLYRIGAYLNVILGTATLLLTFEVMRRLFDVRVGLVAAAIQAVYPNLIFHTAQLGHETLFNFLSTALILILIALPWPEARIGRRRLTGIAVLMGIATYVRPTIVFLLPALAVAWHLAGASWGRALRQSAMIGLLIVAMLAPWTIRNAVRLNSPIVVSTGIGPALCASRHPDARGRFEGLESLQRYCAPASSDVPPEEREVLSNAHSTRTAIKFVIDHPGRKLRSGFGGCGLRMAATTTA